MCVCVCVKMYVGEDVCVCEDVCRKMCGYYMSCLGGNKRARRETGILAF